MRRTYRSKKDTGGGLDHRDVLLNLDEKSSAFDAFYIQNIKQTKRELSSIGSSNHYSSASNRVRKRKYVKRIVKDVEPSRRESQSHSVFLTPDKSIRVNKVLDPFDMLLNSSPAPEDQPKSSGIDSSDKPLPIRRPAVTYTRKKVMKNKKKVNYSDSDSTGSDKENSSEQSNSVQNVTDIKSHELLVEIEPNASPKYGDDSINNIVKNLSLLNNLKRSNSSEFKTPKFNRYRLMKSIHSPILQKSPLCSTPFKEKYRSQSIYKFSPITATSNTASPCLDDTQRSSLSNNSVVLVGNKDTSRNDLPSPVTQVSLAEIDKSIERNEQLLTKNASVQQPIVQSANDDEVNTVLNYSNNLSSNEITSLQITEMEPFLGFSSNEANEIINKINKIEELCNSPIHSNLQQVEELDEPNDYDTKSTEEFQDSVQGGEVDKISTNSGSDDNESLYDTCDSEQLSERNIVSTKPVVILEKMSNSLFFKYYDNMIKNSHTEDSETSKEFEESNKYDESYETSEYNSELTDEISSHDTTDVSTNEDATTSHCTASSSNNEEQYVSFVTTRRRNGGTGKSTVSLFNHSYTGGSEELEKTVLSINTNEEQKTDVNQSKNIVCDSDEINNLNIVRRKSFVKRRRRRYSKSNCDIGNPENTDSDDDSSNDDNLYAFATAENHDETTVSQRKSVNRRSRKTRITQVTEVQSSTNPENSNVDLDKVTSNEVTSETLSDNPAEIIDSDDVIENADTGVSVIPDTNQESIESAVNIISVSGSSDNEVTLQETLAEAINARESDDERPLIKLRKSTRLSRRSTLTARQKSLKPESSNTDVKSEDIVKNKHSIAGDRISKTITRKSSRVFNESMEGSHNCSRTIEEPQGGIVLQPGKKWERSLSIYRRMTMMAEHFDQSILDESLEMKGRKYRQSVITTMELQNTIGSVHNESINSRRSTFVSKPSRSTVRFVNDFNSSRASLNNTTVFDELEGFLADDCDDTIVELSKLAIADGGPEVTVLELHETSNRLTTARDYVLRRCNQKDAILFDECYPDTVLKNCHKIGEGVYGEVFLWRDRDGRARVMKIVPVAGNIKVNGEDQKDFSEIISEIVIAMELSALRAPIAEIERHFDEGKDASALDLHTIENATDVFNEVLAVRCVYGGYPSRLLDLWDLYDECKGSENDNPAILPADQQYIVLELANAGQDLESYQFNNAEQAYSLFYQIAFGLAVGEEAYQFEHRDLHWGNILIAPTEQKYATFVLRGRVHRVLRRGVRGCVIDYSLSRMRTHAQAAALYNDLARDDSLFDAVGDYQFQVYRLMRDKLGNDWKNFEPYTNILWLHYTVDKMITALRYKRTNTKIHKHYIEKLKGLKNRILDYKSATEFVLVDNEY